MAEESEIQIHPLGSTTFKRPALCGAKPDKCFCIRQIGSVQGKKRLNLTQDPALDLVVEIEVTSSSRNRFQVYADLDVAEVWVYDGESLAIHQLQNGMYITSQRSQFFPTIPIPEMAGFLQQAGTEDYLTLVKAFQGWGRRQMGK